MSVAFVSLCASSDGKLLYRIVKVRTNGSICDFNEQSTILRVDSSLHHRVARPCSVLEVVRLHSVPVDNRGLARSLQPPLHPRRPRSSSSASSCASPRASAGASTASRSSPATHHQRPPVQPQDLHIELPENPPSPATFHTSTTLRFPFPAAVCPALTCLSLHGIGVFSLHFRVSRPCSTLEVVRLHSFSLAHTTSRSSGP